MTEEKQAPILTQIQTELKAPKGQYNSFGKYKYRSAEDILEAVKPLLFKKFLTYVDSFCTRLKIFVSASP